MNDDDTSGCIGCLAILLIPCIIALIGCGFNAGGFPRIAAIVIAAILSMIIGRIFIC